LVVPIGLFSGYKKTVGCLWNKIGVVREWQVNGGLTFDVVSVIPAGAIQISSQGETVQSLHTLTMTNATTAGGAIVQYTQGQDGQFYVPGEDGQLTAIGRVIHIPTNKARPLPYPHR